MSTSRIPSGRGGESFIEYAIMIILVAIVILAILLIVGDDLRTVINDLLLRWFPAPSEDPPLSSVLQLFTL